MIEIARYRSRLRSPMRFGGVTFEHREGFFLRIHGADGVGMGEVAPLPGVHRESVEDCIDALRLCGIGDPNRLPPSLAFGVSVARAIAEGDPVLMRPLRRRVGVNELLVDGDLPSPEARTVKVKVGRGDLVSERSRLERILRERPHARLRLDANRSLTLDEATRLVAGLDPQRIDYLEEPLRVPLELPALHFATGMPIALDESLHEPAHRSALETAPGVVAHVVKPSLVGSIMRVRERAERTARQQLRTTVTGTFESSFTLHVLARLITWLPNAAGDHGLGTAGLLVDDPCAAPSIVDGAVSTDAPLPEPEVEFVPLERHRG